MGQEMKMMKKGPWTEEEDIQLVLFVNLYGDRRWDFIAKVSGLKRTGKSCRLRWVNYLHPDLKKGKMTPQEETLVLELHSRWGNRWSRIARKLPGRTDNEIKNYWRTLLRKNTQEKKHVITNPSSPISNISSSSSGSNHVSSMLVGEGDERSFFDTGGLEDVFAPSIFSTRTKEEDTSDMGNDMWKLNTLMGTQEISPLCYDYGEEGCEFTYQTMPSPIWDKYSPGSLWNINTEESKVFAPTNDRVFAGYYVID